MSLFLFFINNKEYYYVYTFCNITFAGCIIIFISFFVFSSASCQKQENKWQLGVINVFFFPLKARAPDSPVIIVGTHYDCLEDKDRRSDYLTNLRSMISDNYLAAEFGGRVQNTRERGLPKVMAMIEVSCKTGYHIRELRQLIYNTSFEIKEKGMLF